MTTTDAAHDVPEESTGKLTLLPLIALVVGSMIGGGVFNLPSDMARGASPGAIIIGWIITGIGMLMLAFVYQGLAVRKPDLNAGPYAYAKAGFGAFVGFNSAWGYWLSAFLGNVAYAVAIFSALSYFFPIFGDGNNLPSIIGASICIWLIHALVLKGIKQAAFVNVVTTIAKLVPLFLFILVAIIAFNWDKFTFDFWGRGDATGAGGLGSIMDQVKSTMLVTLWVFIGIEGASVYSARAARRSDVGTRDGDRLCRRLGLYVLVSLLATGILSQPELARPQGAVDGRRVRIAGRPVGRRADQSRPGGLGRRRVPVLDLAMRRDPLHLRARRHFPEVVRQARTRTARRRNSLWVTNILIQLFLILSFFSQSAYQFFYFIASVAILPPYVLSGAYALKLASSGEGYAAGDKARDEGHRDRRGRDHLRPVAGLCGRPRLPADVRHAVRARHRGLRHGPARAWRARLHRLRDRCSRPSSCCWACWPPG